MGVHSDGSYGIPKGLVYSFPCTVKGDGTYSIVKGIKITPYY
jgi:malate/lactate dehydrogenase